MVIALIGGSCVGKSTLADALAKQLQAKVFTGKDYVRLAKSEADARRAFAVYLKDAAEPVIYVVSEIDQLELLPEKCVRVLMSAPIQVVKERFAQRTGGKLPPPVAAMLEKKHDMFDGVSHEIHLVYGAYEIHDACAKIADMAK